MTLEPSASTAKFAAKRQEIIDEASRCINIHGVAGLSSTEVAQAVGLTHNSIKYYFQRKNDLVLACFDQTFDRLDKLIEMTPRSDDPRDRIVHFIELAFSRIADISTGAGGRFLRIVDLGGVDEPARSKLLARYKNALDRIAGFFGEGRGGEDALLRARMLLETCKNLALWLPLYDEGEHGRIKTHFTHYLLSGIVPGGAARAPGVVRFDPLAGDQAVESYLRAATLLINELGYRGASVNKISSKLNVTKGGFYHHLDTKFELLLDCFDRTFALLARVLDAAERSAGSHLERLASVAYTLVYLQLTEREPLLKIPSIVALPPEYPLEILRRVDMTTRRVAGIFVEGMREGSIPALDPNIASHLIMSMLNTSHEISMNLPADGGEQAALDCVRLMFDGLAPEALGA